MIEEIFRYEQVNFSKLEDYGFKKDGDRFQFETTILEGQFKLIVHVDENGKVSTKTIETELNDEYSLHLVEDSVGAFVGKVRTEFLKVLTDIKDKCFEKDIFKSEQAKQVICYVREKYGDELEYLWEKFPTNAVWRRKDNAKWYGALMVLSKRKLGVKSDEIIDIIDLRIEPEDIEKVVDNKSIFEGYHMNKKHWFTICLDGSVSIEKITKFIDKSFELAKK